MSAGAIAVFVVLMAALFYKRHRIDSRRRSDSDVGVLAPGGDGDARSSDGDDGGDVEGD